MSATGRLTHQDYLRFVPEFERLISRYGKTRVLFIMDKFRGWEPTALWDDLKFDAKHFAAIERLAMVGDKTWQKWMSGFCRPFTTSRIRYFDRSAVQDARTWLNDKTVQVEPTAVLPVFQSKSQTKAYYNKISRFYDVLSDRSEKPVRKAGLELLRAGAGERILEIGFGTGHALVALARAVGSEGKVFGVDLSDQMVRLAKKNLTESGLITRVRLRCGDGARLPYAADSMDAVFMSFTLELFDIHEIPRVLAECKRVLRPGGRILVVGMSLEGEREPLLGIFQWAHKHFPNFIDCRPIYVRAALDNAGFKIQEVLKKHMWIPVEIVLGLKP